MADREYDLVLWGATGFTGTLVAEYIARQRLSGFRWALGGRNEAKLQAVRSRLAAIDSQLEGLPLVVADSSDADALRSLAESTRVVCTTVGPYAAYGSTLVAACVDAGTHCCDLTGEVPWIREMIDMHHARARETGARIVNCCGVDSIPSDLGVWLLNETVRQAGERLAEAQLRVLYAKGAVSGGTAASLLGVLEQARDPKVLRILRDPYSLCPSNGNASHVDTNDPLSVNKDPALHRWSGPFVMASINSRIVRRSNALLSYPYGETFRYSEVTDTGSGLKGFLGAAALTAGLGVFASLGITGPGRRVLRWLLPAPGEGPSKTQREAGSFRMGIYGLTTHDQRYWVLVEGQQDPGYGETAKMLGESALCLAQDPLSSEGGLLTPASAMGSALLERLQRAGMTFRSEAGWAT